MGKSRESQRPSGPATKLTPDGDQIFDNEICRDFTLNRIAAELQTWDTDMLITMVPVTHGDGNRLIRLTLAGRGVGKVGDWIGFDRAAVEWGVE